MTSEDDNPPFGGPPPDPTERTWRHPSEVAAAAAARSLDADERDRNRRFSVSSFVFGGTVGVAACLALYGLVWSGTTTSAVELAVFPTGPTIASLPNTNPAPDTTVDRREAVRSDASSSTASASDDRHGGNAVGEAEPQRRPLPGHLEPVASQHLVSIRPVDSSEPLGSGLFIDGLVLCSAEALAERDNASILVAGHRLSATLAGVDPFTDLAVLVPDQRIDASDTDAVEPADPAEGDSITLLAVDSHPEPIAVAGKVLTLDQRLTARSGHAILGAFETSARLPETGLGSVLVDDVGRPVGLVISSDGYLASAIPLAVARRLANNIVTTGWASEAWLGIEGRDVAFGVEVTSIDEWSPAATAGVEVGDVIRRIDGVSISDMVSLVDFLRERNAGDVVELELRRGASSVDHQVELLGYVTNDDAPSTGSSGGDAISAPADD